MTVPKIRGGIFSNPNAPVSKFSDKLNPKGPNDHYEMYGIISTFTRSQITDADDEFLDSVLYNVLVTERNIAYAREDSRLEDIAMYVDSFNYNNARWDNEIIQSDCVREYFQAVVDKINKEN